MNRIIWGCVAALPLLATASLLSAAPGARLVRDIAIEPLSPLPIFSIAPSRYVEQPSPLVPFGDGVIFGADDGMHGRELWRSGGTLSTTFRLKDLCPGPCNGLTSDPIAAGARFFFSATDGAFGSELWTSDGTPGGTVRLTDLCWGPCNGLWLSGSWAAKAAAGRLFFAGPEPGASLASPTRQALWVSDGTRNGTRQITPAHQGFVSVSLAFGNRVLARVDSRLWVSDGTEAGTRPLADLLGEPAIGIVAGSDGGVLLALGTGTATRLVLLSPDLAVRDFAPCDWCAYGLGAPRTDDLYVVLHEDLFRIQPATGSSVPLVHLGGRGPGVNTSVVVGGRVLLAIHRGAYGEAELVGSDGTRTGTQFLGPPQRLEGQFAVVGSQALFGAYRKDLGFEPWISDGTIAGTHPLADLAPGPDSSGAWSFVPVTTAAGARAAFLVTSPGLSGELFLSDGTVEGTAALPEPRRVAPASSPRALTAVGERLLFSAEQRATGRELWISRGSGASTALAADLVSGSIGSDPRDFLQHGNATVFRAAGRLWQAGRAWLSILPISGGIGVAAPVHAAFGVFTYARSDGYCPVTDGCSEPFAWRTGSPGLDEIRDIWPGWISYFPITGGSGPATSFGLDPLAFRDGVIFGAHDGETGLEPWFTDGTLAGTRQIVDLCPESNADWIGSGSQAHLFRAFGDRVVFATRAGSCLPGLAVTDGTADGTRFLSQGAGEVQELLVARGIIWALMRTPAGDELWRSDGTAAGTVPVRALAGPHGERAFAQKLAGAGQLLYFTVIRDDTGEELWRSDGTAAGTRMLNVAPGVQSAAPSDLREIAGQLAFTASDGVHGAELWVTDGTQRRTRMVADVAAGADASSPAEFTRVGGMVYFSAADREHGRELWGIDVTAFAPRRGPAAASPD